MDIKEEAVDRILRILQRTYKRLKIAICLPTLLRGGKLKESLECLDRRELEKLLGLHEKISSVRGERILCAESQGGSLERLTSSEHSELKIQWKISLQSLEKHEEELVLIIEERIEEMPLICRKIIDHVRLLKEIVEWQMRRTPKQLRERKAKLRNAEVLIKMTREEIESLERRHEEEIWVHEESVKKLEVEIEEVNRRVGQLSQKHEEELEREVSCYKKTMREMIDGVAEEETNLDNQLHAHEQLLEKLVEANLEKERLLRERFAESERKYMAARNSFDRDLRKLNELKETLELQLRVANNHYDVLKNEYEVQSVLFMNLKKERELAMMQAFAEQLDNFEKNRAARIIQRTWRAYHERISTKKKKRTRRNK